MKNNSTENENKLMTELPILIVALIPFIYLLLTWDSLNEQVPMHWNFKGEIDHYDDKSTLWFVLFLVNIPMYLLMLFLPKLDPKGKNIELMGKKYARLRLILQLLMSALSCIIIYSSTEVREVPIETMMGFGFALFLILFGNYMGSIRQNYFVGIRTPWTLKNEEVWKKTHQLCGRMWIVAGLSGLAIMLFLPGNWALITIIGLMIVPTIVALVYSYQLFKKLEKGS